MTEHTLREKIERLERLSLDYGGLSKRPSGKYVRLSEVLAILDAHTAAQPATDAVVEAARAVIAAWKKSAPMMNAAYHGEDCDCLRCAMGDLERALAKGQQP